MGDYLKLFKNESDYDESSSKGRVNHIVDGLEVKIEGGSVRPEYVEIAGILWATKNVGASTETEVGNYYQYGKGARDYQATSGETDYSGSENPLAASADTAVQVLGNGWRMPTKAEFQSLTANTDYSWVTINGVVGGKFTDKTDSSKYIFIPAAGCYDYGDLTEFEEYGRVWSSTPWKSSYSYHLKFYEGYDIADYDTYRDFGFSVRPVLDIAN